MATTRSNDFLLVDYTDEVNLLPRTWSLLTGMNMFQLHPISTTVAQVERVQEVNGLFSSKARGGERNYVTSEDAITRNFNVPFFPLDRGITANDVQNFRRYGSGEDSKTLQDEVIRVMQRITRMHAQLKERILSACIFNGTSYEGEGVSPAYNYFTEFGQTQATADVDLTDGLTDPFETLEAGRQHIATAAQDEMMDYAIVMFCGKDYFSKIIQHPYVQEAYKYYSSEQDPLRKRLGMNSLHRTFFHKNILLVEVINDYLDADKAVMLPWAESMDFFRLYVAPADDAALANTVGQEMYLYYKEDEQRPYYQ